MNATDAGPFKVGDWLVEPELLRISNKGDIRKLEYKTMEILLYFVSNHGEVVSKDKLHAEVWKDVYVTDNALTRAVSRLRKAFDDDPLHPNYIDTISKSGYRLVAPVIFNPTAEFVEPSISTMATHKRSFWVMAVLFVIGGISMITTSSNDEYAQFYDPVPVSTLVGPERGLAISPDGEKISFSYSEPNANNSDVYVKLLNDFSQIKFTDDSTHQGYGIWSPDGNYMAYISLEDGSCGIYKEPSIGGKNIRIGDCYRRPEDFVWSPDGKTIAFTDYKPGKQTRSIFFLDIATHISEENLTPEGGMSDRDPAITPNGAYLVFRRGVSNQGSDIYKMRFSDKSLTRLTSDNSRILGLDIFDNGEQIAFSSNRGGPWAMWKMPIEGGEITRLHINDRVPAEPKFSRNGKRMVYKSLRDQIRLWTFEKKGVTYKTPIQVAASTRSEMHPSLSSDGKEMVFISNRSGSYEVWSHNFENKSYAKLTSLEGSFVNMPSWSPDNAKVVFDARIDGDNAIYILDVASKMVRTFIDLEGDQVNARYSRDGQDIYFASNHTGTWQIWKKSIIDDHANIEQVTVHGGFHLQEGPYDGFLYYSRSDTSGLWRMEKGEDAKAKLFINNLSNIDWGNWSPVSDGIIYIDPSAQVFKQSYNEEEVPIQLFAPPKRIQMANPTISATFDGNKIILAQIEKSEDEIMMVDFK